MKQVTTAFIFVLLIIFTKSEVYARVTPDDIIKTKRQTYEKKLTLYSENSHQKLKKFENLITQVNKKRTNQLDEIMQKYAAILDEYEKRVGDRDKTSVEKARYWITFAHEAVAFQAAKIYIFDLTSEKNLVNDIDFVINLLQSDLNSTRSKVINSQKILKQIVKKQ